MKKFRFKLSAVLLMRELELSKAEAAYGEATRKRIGIESEIKQIENDLQALLANIESRRTTSFHPAEQEHFSSADRAARMHLSGVQQKWTEAHQAEKAALIEFMKAKKGFDSISEIKGKMYQEYIKEETKREERELEDITNARYRIMA